MVFLATPHRASDIATLAKRMIPFVAHGIDTGSQISDPTSMSILSQSPRLLEMNEMFQRIAPTVDVVSFYETLPTDLGVNKTVSHLPTMSRVWLC